jgi:O-antigen ligase
MQQAVQRARTKPSSLPSQLSSRRLPWHRFFLRYPIFFLAFGPPLFRSVTKYAGVDTSKVHYDIWTVLQLGLVGVISLRAFLRLTNTRLIRMTAPVRSVVRYCFFLGLLFAISIVYSPGRAVSFAYVVIYFLILISVVEFLVDAYRTPPDWMQCLFALRLVSVLLLLAVLVTLAIRPTMVLFVLRDAGIRLLGGSVATMPLICPVIAIVSAYSFLHSLEPRWRAALLTLAGIGGTVATQWRGAEIGLAVVFLVLGFLWARENLRSAYLFAAISAILLFTAIAGIAAVGAGRVWSRFNRGGDLQNVLTLSGRTELWSDVIAYCAEHPEGMGYISGIRNAHITVGGGTSLDATLNRMGGADNSYFEILADAGWLALLLYLVILIKVTLLGSRFAAEYGRRLPRSEFAPRRAVQCGMLILGFCLIDGMDSSIFAIPMSQGYYFQQIAMVIILGAVSAIILARRRSTIDRPGQFAQHAHHSLRSNLPNS